MIDRKLLMRFCATETMRHRLDLPIVIDGREYFTNGKCVVWTPTKTQNSTHAYPPSLKKLVAELEVSDGDWSRLVCDKPKACPNCRGDESICEWCVDGLALGEEMIELGGLIVDRWYAYHLGRIPGMEWARSAYSGETLECVVLRFAENGGGVLMTVERCDESESKIAPAIRSANPVEAKP